jgi:YVTN family beta-propeller protein
VAVSTFGDRVYVANGSSGSVSTIDTATNSTMGNPIPVGRGLQGVAVSQEDRVYVTNGNSGSVSVIDTATNEVDRTIGVGRRPQGVAVSREDRVYVTNGSSDSLSVITF